MHERIRIDHGSLEAKQQQIEKWEIPQSVKGELFRFLDDLGLGKVNRGKRLSPARQLKYLHALKTPLEFFNKPSSRLRLRDIENFERALASGQLCTRAKRKPYAHSTQVDMRMLLKIFLRWRLGSAKALSLAGWLDTRVRPRTPDFLKESEIEQLYKHCHNAQQRFLIAVLFDSGARAEEFHNIRYEDIFLPEGKESFARVTLKQEYSKTLGRTIGLFWTYSLEAVKEYLAERVAEGIKPAEPVFRGQYSATRKFLQRLGQRALKRPVHYHLFRHSSATYYGDKMNRQQLCIRYGWNFSSDMPDVYIARSGIETKALEEKFTQTDLGALKEDQVQLKQANRIKEERIQQLEGAMRIIRQDLDAVSKVLRLNPAAADIEMVAQRKMRNQARTPLPKNSGE
jgi:integrase